MICSCAAYNPAINPDELKYFRALKRLANDINQLRLTMLAKLTADGYDLESANQMIALILAEQTQEEYTKIADEHYLKTAQKSFEEQAKTAAISGDAYQELLPIFEPKATEETKKTWSVKQTEYYKVLKSRQGSAEDFYSVFDAQNEKITEWLTDGAERGLTAEQMIADAAKRDFSGTGAKALTPAATSKLATIARTETSAAINQGSAIELLASDIEYCTFTAVSSDVLCSFCAGLNGKIFRKNSKVFWDAVPPLHYNCRCRVAPVSSRVLKYRKISESEIYEDEKKIEELPKFQWS